MQVGRGGGGHGTDGTTLADAVRSAATLDAMARSAETGSWVEVAAP